MKTKTFSERLNLCLDKLGFPPKNYGRIQLLADMVGLSHRGAGKWVSGQSSPPSGKFSSLAKQLQVNEAWLRTGEGFMCSQDLTQVLEHSQLDMLQEVPLYSQSQVLHRQPSHTQNLTCRLPYKSDFFAINLMSEAMSPRFPSGSILIFDALAIPNDGDFVLVSDADYPDPIFRQYLLSAEQIFLYAYNPKFERISSKSGHRILGKLAQAILSFI